MIVVEHLGIEFTVAEAVQWHGVTYYDAYDPGGPDLGCWRALSPRISDLLEAIRDRAADLEDQRTETQRGVVVCTNCRRHPATTTSFFEGHPPICDNCANAESYAWWMGGIARTADTQIEEDN